MNFHPQVQVDLHNCDREPIHIPGSIQPHGALFAFHPRNLELAYWTQNVEALFGKSLRPGSTPDQLFDPQTVSAIRQISQEPPGVVAPIDAGVAIGDGQLRHTAAAHLHDGMLLLEVEIAPQDDAHSAAVAKLPRLLKTAAHRMQACQTMEELYQSIANQIKSISGFDRVMIYQFMEDGHGVVVGEAAEPELETYLGLHYPATDIPQQARRLYQLNAVRLIADIDAQPTPILAAAELAQRRPLDLTYSYFRSVSPIHIEYLKNMGVAASMSISILQRGVLWGLIACHHYQPLNLSLEVRDACELVGVAAGVYVTSRQMAEDSYAYRERREHLHKALRTIAASESYHAGVDAALETMAKIVDADGVVACLGDDTNLQWGKTPGEAQVFQLIARIAAGEPGLVWSSHTLAAEFPDLGPLDADVAGMLALKMGDSPSTYVLFFRSEYAHEVAWAGKPEKIEIETAAGVRLSPRKSFETWAETVRQQARQWSPIDRDMASELQSGLVELIGRRAMELSRVNEELARINDDLDAFAFAASHDLREQTRSMKKALQRFEDELQQPLAKSDADRFALIDRSCARLDELLEGLLRMSRAGRGDLHYEQVDLAEIAAEAAEMIWGSSTPSRVQLSTQPMPEAVVDFLCVREIFCNLFTNADKYNQSDPKTIDVGAVELGEEAPSRMQGKIAYYVKDNGIGIPAAEQDRVFEIFRRLHRPDQFGGGSGAGLTIVKKMVERHGGTIWINSKENVGTTFFFTLR